MKCLKMTASVNVGYRIGMMLSAYLCLLLPAALPATADGLFHPSSSFASLVSDSRAVKIGDVLHIIVTETAQASQKNSDATSTSTEARIGPGIGAIDFLPEWGYGGSISSQAAGSTTRSESLVGRIAVTVVGMNRAGNLLVEGERTVRVHKDYQVLTLRGEVRPRDITVDNTIASHKVANASITYTGSNPARPRSKVGLVTRLLHLLF